MSDIEQMLEALAAPPAPAVEVVTLERATVEGILTEMEEKDAHRPAVIYLRSTLAEPKLELWAIHSVGPGEVTPCLSKEDAERQAKELRELGDKMKAERVDRGESVEHWCDWVTNVIPSPWEPADHFAILAEEWQDAHESLRHLHKDLQSAHDAALAREAALQQRLNETDQRLDELISAVRSLNRGKVHEIRLGSDDQPVYWQRKEWIDWMLELCDQANDRQRVRESAKKSGYPGSNVIPLAAQPPSVRQP